MIKVNDKEAMKIYGGAMILPLGLPDMTLYKIVKSFIQNYLRR